MSATTPSRLWLCALFAGLLLVIGFASPAAAQQVVQQDPYVSDEGQEQGEVGDGTVTNELGDGTVTNELGTTVAGDSVVSSTLPLTGGESLALVAIGGVLLAAGSAAVIAGRRRGGDTA